MGLFTNLFNSQPTVPNDLQAALNNAKGVVSNNNVLESLLATAVMSNMPKLESAQWLAMLDNYLGAGEVAAGLGGTEVQQEAAGVAGGDVVASADGINTALIPMCVKCALVHAGLAAKADNVKTQVTEALTLAVTAAMPKP